MSNQAKIYQPNSSVVRKGFSPTSIEDVHGYHPLDKMHFSCEDCKSTYPVPFDGAGHVWLNVERCECCDSTKFQAVGV